MRPEEHVNEIVFAGEIVKVGRWRLPAGHPNFCDSGPTRHYLVVFPRTSAWIQHAGERAFAADTSVATLYNAGQEYRRKAIAPVGDLSDYYAFDPQVLREAVAAWDPAARDAASRVLRFMRAPCDTSTYLTQRAVYRYVRRCAAPDRLFVEETMIGLAVRLLGAAYDRRPEMCRSQRDLAEHARAVVARHFASGFTLTQLAAVLGTSVFHLCRVFRASTGTTIHAYRNQLRLRAALERLLDSTSDLSAIALDLGYTSHSHFTAVFRACYGMTPSAARREYVPSKATVQVFPSSVDRSQT
jgi:AraC family transcriptional regulator